MQTTFTEIPIACQTLYLMLTVEIAKHRLLCQFSIKSILL